jgi:hypothetical protein
MDENQSRIFSLSGLRVDVDTKEKDKTVYIKIV